MKNYYCIVVLGDITNIHKILQSVVSGKLFFVNYSGVFVGTFESDFSAVEIDQMLYTYKKCFILTKMLSDSFSSFMVDGDIQGHLFGDYIYKNVKHKDKKDFGYSGDTNGMDFNSDQDLSNIPIDDYVDMFGDDQSEFGDFEDLNTKPKKKDTFIPSTDDIDILLDKISKVGYDKLNQDEKNILKIYSNLK